MRLFKFLGEPSLKSLRYSSSFYYLKRPLKLGQKLLAKKCFRVLLFFHSGECHMVDFIVKFVIFICAETTASACRANALIGSFEMHLSSSKI